MQTHMTHLVCENEILKQKVDSVLASSHPEIFESTQEVSDMIENWMEMDMRDGDELLAALGRVHPPSSQEVETMLADSVAIRQKESSLEEHYRYFERRFRLFQSIWAKVVGIHMHMDEAFKRFKESMAAALLSAEPVLGKKSQALDDLREEVRKLMDLKYGEFMDQQWHLQKRIIEIKSDHCTRRLDDKELEKQQFFAKCKTDLTAMKAKYEQELEGKQAEINAILEEKRLKEQQAKNAISVLKKAHLGKITQLKEALKEQLKDLAGNIKADLQGFATYQGQIQSIMKAFCEGQEKQVAALKIRHRQEKYLMKSLISKANFAFREDYQQLVGDFSAFQQEIQLKIVHFCDFYKEDKLQSFRQYDSRIDLLLEDARCEAKRRDEKAIRGKKAVLRLISQFRREIFDQSGDFAGYLQAQKDQLKAFCEHTTAYFCSVRRKSDSELAQTISQYENKLGLVLEDFRAEVEKSDRKSSNQQAKFTSEKQLLKVHFALQNSKLRKEVIFLMSDFQELMTWARKWVYACMCTGHDEYTFELRQEGLARSNMLREELIQAVIKRDKAGEDLGARNKQELGELGRQFRNTEEMLKEDALSWVFLYEENSKKQDLERAKTLESCLNAHLASLESTVSSHFQASSAVLAPLQLYGLHMPVPSPPNNSRTEPVVCAFPQQGGDLCYLQAFSALQTAFRSRQLALERLLQDKVSREGWLVEEWIQLESRRNTLQSTLNSTITDHEKQVLGLRMEISDQRNCIEDLEVNIEGKREELGACQAKLATHVDGAQQIIDQLKLEIRENERKYELTKRAKAYRRVITDYQHWAKGIKRSFWLRWRLNIVSWAAPVEEPKIAFFDDDDSEGDDETEMDLVEAFIQEEYRSALENNVMVEAFTKSGGKPERPLTIPQALKFFEDMMDKKYEADVGDIKNGRPLRTLPDFFLEFMSRTFGLKKLAVKMLCQVIPTLEIMNREGTAYCQLFCRLVQVSHPSPVPFQLAVFLTRVRIEFNTLAEKYQRDKDARDSKKGVKREVGKGKDSSGGEAYLLDVIVYLNSLFESDRRSSELMLKHLQPSGVATADYVIFRICHKVSKLGVTLDTAFAMLDKDGSGSLSEAEFVRASRRTLELWLASEDLSMCFRTIVSGSKEMTKEMFLARINFKSYLENCKSDLYIVSRVTFLMSLIEVYHSRQKRDGAHIKVLIGFQGAVPQDAFGALVRRMEPNIVPEKIAALFNESVKLTPDPAQGVAVGAVIKVLLRHPVGTLKNSPFCKD